MSLKQSTPHQHKCYCSSELSTCCNSNYDTQCLRQKQQWRQRDYRLDRAASSRGSKAAVQSSAQPKFVKIKRTNSAAAANARCGLGHSSLTSTNFSRRNSAATTVTFFSPCVTPTPTPPAPAPLSDVSFAYSTPTPTVGGLRHEFTERRRYYETAKELMALVSAQTAERNASHDDDNRCAEAAVQHERLLALQRFRLQHADECFSAQRQRDLQLQQRSTLPATGVGDELLCTITAKSDGAAAEPTLPQQHLRTGHKAPAPKQKQLTPYAVRQRLLRLRLEAESIGRAKPGRKLYGTLDKSCALRYQETY